MAEKQFQQFLDVFQLPQSVADNLTEANVRSVEELATSETSTIRELVDHPVLNTILPILQQHSDEISRATNPHQHALYLLHRHADEEDEEISSSNIPTDGNQMPSVNDTPSTSTFRATTTPEQSNQIVSLNQSIGAEDEEEISEQALNLQDEDFESGIQVSLSVSGCKIDQLKVGETNIYKIQHVEVTNVYLPLKQEDQPTTSFNEKQKFGLNQSNEFQMKEKEEHVEVTNVYLPLKQEDQPTTSFNEKQKFGLNQSNEFQMKEKEDETNNAIAKLREAVRERNRADLDVDLSQFDITGITSHQLPDVHPEIYSIKFYDGKLVPNDEQYNPKLNKLQLSQSDKKKTIEEFISDYKSQNFISLVSPPGAGKTTLSKRLTRHLAAFDDFAVLRFLFLNMATADNEKLTLKKFLLGDVNLKLNKNETNCAFDWIVNHPDKCFLIFDGFDQVDWTITKKVKVNPQFDTCFSTQDLVSMLCQGSFLQNCHILFTSRPHAMLNIPKRCRPTKTFFLRDLTSHDMEKLFFVLVNDQPRADQLWNVLQTNSPQLAAMCHNPLFLQLYLRASLSSSANIGIITTTTKVFQEVLKGLKQSDHVLSLNDATVKKLARIAFKAMERRTVLITFDDLKQENLSSAEIQDIVVTLHGANKSCGLFEGSQRFYFSHQMFQEYFAAFYMTHEMSHNSFASFLKEEMLKWSKLKLKWTNQSDVDDDEYDELIGHWSVVVNFLSGIIFDPDSKNDEQTSTRTGFLTKFLFRNKDKKDLFLEALKKETTTVAKEANLLFSKYRKLLLKYVKMSEEVQESETTKKEIENFSIKLGVNSFQTLSTCNMLFEANSEEVIKAVAACFVHGGINLFAMSPSQSDVQAVARVIKATPSVKLLDLSHCSMDSDKFAAIREAVERMSGKIGVMVINNGGLTGVDDIIPMLHKIETELWMMKCFVDDSSDDDSSDDDSSDDDSSDDDSSDDDTRSANNEEKNLLQEVLNQLENTNLKIYLDYDFDNNQMIFITHKNRVNRMFSNIFD